MHTALYMYMAFYIPIAELYEGPRGNLNPQIFFLRFWPGSCLCQVLSLRQLQVKQFCWLFLTNALWINLFPQRELWVRSNNDSRLQMELFRELLDRSNSNNHLGIRLSEELQIQCDLFTCCKIAGFHSYCVCQAVGFQGYYKAGEKRMGAGDSTKKFAILIKLLRYFLSKHTSNHCKSSTDFQISEKVDVDNFCCHFHCFYVGADLWRSSSLFNLGYEQLNAFSIDFSVNHDTIILHLSCFQIVRIFWETKNKVCKLLSYYKNNYIYIWEILSFHW